MDSARMRTRRHRRNAAYWRPQMVGMGAGLGTFDALARLFNCLPQTGFHRHECDVDRYSRSQYACVAQEQRVIDIDYNGADSTRS